ncbi:hypothetical protein TetV_515 [Tetraselmis virus 1]|uniref:Uncharacterized protein n=1 Tax=Tetraselmis virus 1 TaxID=2060617 RepID=A0A2P0VNX2_9VIRU|nr:hypothetical protein QJ968_gp539 [Tetraselmis virus 1]AUF82597.1 hypothetical protein TetV_515 [Tetraselmis virus 1]
MESAIQESIRQTLSTVKVTVDIGDVKSTIDMSRFSLDETSQTAPICKFNSTPSSPQIHPDYFASYIPVMQVVTPPPPPPSEDKVQIQNNDNVTEKEVTEVSEVEEVPEVSKDNIDMEDWPSLSESSSMISVRLTPSSSKDIGSIRETPSNESLAAKEYTFIPLTNLPSDVYFHNRKLIRNISKDYFFEMVEQRRAGNLTDDQWYDVRKACRIVQMCYCCGEKYADHVSHDCPHRVEGRHDTIPPYSWMSNA